MSSVRNIVIVDIRIFPPKVQGYGDRVIAIYNYQAILIIRKYNYLTSKAPNNGGTYTKKMPLSKLDEAIVFCFSQNIGEVTKSRQDMYHAWG
jgi:hypothetical protein